MINLNFNNKCPFCNQKLTSRLSYNYYRCYRCEPNVDLEYKSKKLQSVTVYRKIANKYNTCQVDINKKLFVYNTCQVDINKKLLIYNYGSACMMPDFESLQDMIDIIDTLIIFD